MRCRYHTFLFASLSLVECLKKYHVLLMYLDAWAAWFRPYGDLGDLVPIILSPEDKH